MSRKSDLKPIGLIGEMSLIVGEDYEAYKAKIPLNPIVNVEKLKDGDSDPYEVIIAVKWGASRRGWVYDRSAYDAIVEQILTGNVIMPSFYGHQSRDAVQYEGREIQGAVVGALLENEVIYYRIILDQDAKKMKRWLRNRQISAVSIWGYAQGEMQNGTFHVTGYRLLSVDFVPPNTEGQENAFVAEGEMLSHGEARGKVHEAVLAKYPDWVWLEEMYDDFAILEKTGQYYKIPYSLDEKDQVTLGDAILVKRVISYIPVDSGERKQDMDLKDASTDDLMRELKRREPDQDRIAGEMGFLPTSKSEHYQKIVAAAGEMDPLDLIALGQKKKADDVQAEADRLAGEMVEEATKDLTDEGKKLVRKFGRFTPGMTKEQVSGEMARVLADEDVKTLLARTQPLIEGGKLNSEIPEVEV